MGVLNELKRSKIRFSAPSAPRKFWDLGVSHNTPLVSQHLETRGVLWLGIALMGYALLEGVGRWVTEGLRDGVEALIPKSRVT